MKSAYLVIVPCEAQYLLFEHHKAQPGRRHTMVQILWTSCQFGLPENHCRSSYGAVAYVLKLETGPAHGPAAVVIRSAHRHRLQGSG